MRPHADDLIFRKSSYSSGGQEICVEVADLPGASAVRDTQNRGLGHLTFGSAEWAPALKAAIKEHY